MHNSVGSKFGHDQHGVIGEVPIAPAPQSLGHKLTRGSRRIQSPYEGPRDFSEFTPHDTGRRGLLCVSDDG